MYKVNGKRMFTETLVLTGRSLLPKRLTVKIDIEIVKGAASGAMKKLQAATEKLQAAKDWDESAFKEYCAALDSALDIILGEKNRKAIVKYFNGQYISMAAAITPFITDVITPALGAGLAKATRK